MNVSNVALALCLDYYKHEWETKGQVSYYQACRKTYIVFRRKQEKAPKALKLPKDNNKISQINNH